MDLFIFDSTLTKVQSVLTELELIEAVEERELGKAGQLTFTIANEYANSVKELNIVAVPVEGSKVRLYVVSNKAVEADTTTITAISYPNYFLSRVGYVKDLRPKERPLKELIPQILGDSGFTLNKVDSSLAPYTGSFYYMSRLEALSQISETIACEFDLYATISKNALTGQYVDVVSMLGSDTGKRFEYGSNALEVVAEYDATEVYSQAIGRGKGEEVGDGYGRRIEFTDVEWKKSNGDPVDKPKGQNWVDDPYGNYMLPTQKRALKILEFEEIEDPAYLLSQTYSWLVNNNRPKVQFKASVTDVDGLELGDRVQIVRSDLNLRYTTRVFSVKRNLLNESLNEISLGDNIATTPMDKLNSMTETINKATNTIQRVEQQVTMIDATGVRVNYGDNEPSNKKPGDIWYKTQADGSIILLRWNGEEWERVVDDKIIEEIDKAVEDAMNEAESAKQTAQDSANRAQQAIQDAQLAQSNLARLESETGNKFVNVNANINGLQTQVTNLDKNTTSSITNLDNLIQLQAQQIGPFYPNGSFIDKTFDKYYSKIYSEAGSYVTIPSGSDYLLLRTGVNAKASALLTDFIAIDMNKPIEIKYKAYFNNTTYEKCKIHVHEYDENYKEVRNASDVVFSSDQVAGRWYDNKKSWIVNKTNKPRYIKVEWVVWDDGNGNNEMRVSNITLSNGQANISANINVLTDNIGLMVKKDNIINQINISTEGILIDGAKTHITNTTTIDKAVIKDAMVSDLSASKLTAGTIDASKINVINLNAANITGVNAQFVSASFKSASGNYLQLEGDGMVATSDSWYSTKIEYGARGLEVQNWSGDWVGSMRYVDDGPWRNGDGIVLGARRSRGLMFGWQASDGTKSPYKYSVGMDGDTGDWFAKNNLRLYSGEYTASGNPFIIFGNYTDSAGNKIARIGGDANYQASIGWTSQDLLFKDNRGGGYYTLDRILKACGIRS